MSLRGYKKKGKPAIWQQAFPEQVIEVPVTKLKWNKKTLEKVKPNFGKVSAAAVTRKVLKDFAKTFKRIRPVSKSRQKVTTEYRREARAFVKAAVKRGETCPVVAAIEQLRHAVAYGCPISARLNEVHHTRGRAGSLLLDKRYWMAVSKAGHRYIHLKIEEARKRGWICAEGLWNKPDRT